jgi:hypothetical protein
VSVRTVAVVAHPFGFHGARIQFGAFAVVDAYGLPPLGYAAKIRVVAFEQLIRRDVAKNASQSSIPEPDNEVNTSSQIGASKPTCKSGKIDQGEIKPVLCQSGTSCCSRSAMVVRLSRLQRLVPDWHNTGVCVTWPLTPGRRLSNTVPDPREDIALKCLTVKHFRTIYPHVDPVAGHALVLARDTERLLFELALDLGEVDKPFFEVEELAPLVDTRGVDQLEDKRAARHDTLAAGEQVAPDDASKCVNR